MAEAETTVYFVGTAGAGKSTLVAAYDRWAKQHAISTVTVNLDPGAESLPYQPDIDIRDTIRLDEVMAEHGLGPNGAQVAAADMIALRMDELQAELSSYRGDQILIDTPGQVELFVFRLSGKLLVESLRPTSSAIAYLLDPYLARTASGFASQLLLAATTRFRFQQPLVPLLTKADIVEEEARDTIARWAEDAGALESDVLRDEPSMNSELAANVSRLLASLGAEQSLIQVSAADDSGLDDLYTVLQSALGLAEDATPEYDTFLGPGDADLPVN